MNIAFFDFDGTITERDTLLDFIIYSFGYIKFFSGFIRLIPSLILFKLKIYKNWEAKEKAFMIFFSGLSLNRFNELAYDYTMNKLPFILRDNAIQAINTHKSFGDTIVIVSASVDLWIKPWCDKNNLNLISTRLEIKNNHITGKIDGKNCYGIEKLNRILSEYNLSQYEHIYAYGDSKGDKEMLSLAETKYYKWQKV